MTQRAKQQNPRRREVAGSIPVFASKRKKKLYLYSLYVRAHPGSILES
jgi:hypothetical protein